MIDLRINEQSLQLDPNFAIQLNLVSPMFSDSIGYSSHSFKFNLPMTDRNRAILEHSDSVLSYQNIPSFDVRIFLNGQFWKEGLMNLESFSLNKISVSLEIAEGRFALKLGEKALREYEYGGVRTIAAPGANELVNPATITTVPTDSPMIEHATATTAGTADDFDYVFFPVRNKTMYADAYEQIQSLVDYDPTNYLNWWRIGGGFWDEGRQIFTANFETPPQTYSDLGIHTLIPFPYLVYVLGRLIAENGYELDSDSDFLFDEEIRQLVFINPVTLDKKYFLDILVGSTQVAGIAIAANGHKEKIRISDHLPTINSRDFWRELCSLFGLATFVENNKIRLVAKKDHANALNQIDWRNKTIDYFHEPTSVDFLFGTDANTGDAFDTETTTYEAVEAVTTVENQSDLPVSGVALETVYYVSSENAFYRYDLQEQGAQTPVYVWKLAGFRNETVKIGTGKDGKLNAIGVTQPYQGYWATEGVYANTEWEVPQIDMLNISPSYNLQAYEFGPKLCFYRGIKENLNGYEYPYGSSDADIPAGHNYSLRWHGPGNLYDTWHKSWVEMLQKSRTMKLYLNLSIGDVLDLDWLKKPRIRVADGEAVCLLKSVTIRIDATGIGLVEADAVRL